MEKPGEVSRRKWCCMMSSQVGRGTSAWYRELALVPLTQNLQTPRWSSNIRLLRAASRYWKAFHQVHIGKGIRIILNLESLLNWDPARKGLRIRRGLRGWTQLKCRMFWQACMHIHIYSVHLYQKIWLYIVSYHMYIILNITLNHFILFSAVDTLYYAMLHDVYTSINLLHTLHSLNTSSKRSISCTCASKEHVAEENQQPTRHWRPFSWRDPDGRIPHLRSRSSYISLHLLYFKDNSMCFKDFSQIGSLEGRWNRHPPPVESI